jgi:hypothetical protein
MAMKMHLLDSVGYIQPDMAGDLLITGSHGGISSARFASQGPASLIVFNDAGVGKMEAGIAGLMFLQDQGIPACTVAHTSACIGVAQSTLEDGVISHANAHALALGITVGQACRDVVARMQATQ